MLGRETCSLLPLDLCQCTNMLVDASGRAMYYRIRVPVVSLDLHQQLPGFHILQGDRLPIFADVPQARRAWCH
eukprot:COSAG05_NODE_4523_length_1480_cov_1.112238_1_plen_73_part_00